MSPARIVLATANRGKVGELRTMLAAWPLLEVRALDAFPVFTLPPEDGATYEENAILKARAVATATGWPALADDSGLEVEALDGAPGLYSARWAADDAARIERLLRELAGRADRRARFVCVVALAWPDGRVVTATGACPGVIAGVPVGRSGFGYDPIFVADALGRTFAEVAAAEKDAVSHRALAIRALAARLREAPSVA
ncbi:MAG: RdgB/HAM1 family non-canonical purine NTP pyrophosphatase [bacterium]|nr:RdgB/HAM1 family non-canonical purine NTP pyrophosphatase [bacterium]